MTTTVTVTANGEQTAYVYTAQLGDDLYGEFKLTAELHNESRTFHAHNHLDIMITENKLDDEEEDSPTTDGGSGS